MAPGSCWTQHQHQGADSYFNNLDFHVPRSFSSTYSLFTRSKWGALWLESIQVLSYNLFWWHLFKVEGGRSGSAGHLIRSTSQPPYDVMGFQECEDPEKVLGPAGLLQDLETGHGWVCL